MKATLQHLVLLILTGIGLALLSGCSIDIGAADEEEQPPPNCAPDCPDGRCPFKTVAPMDLPAELRNANYDSGSCMHAAFQDVLVWQHQASIAAWWRTAHSGAAGIQNVTAIADRLGLRFAYTTDGDEGFLEWASRTRRGAAIYWNVRSPTDHAITFCGFTPEGEAVLVDNNRPREIKRMSRQEFLARWHYNGGCAVTLVHTPAPPRPWI